MAIIDDPPDHGVLPEHGVGGDDGQPPNQALPPVIYKVT